MLEDTMERHELEQWLCAWGGSPTSPAAVGGALGLPTTALSDTTFVRAASRVRSLRFILALLQDAFADDADMRRWLETPRAELSGCSPTSALSTGQCELVEALAVQTWNDVACLAAV
jgi:hypothetical protein